MRSRLLVVDDDRFLQQSLVSILVSEGFEVKSVFTGEDALESIQNEPPDFVLLDLSLPGIDGLQVCQRIRDRHQIPVVILSARSDASDITSGLAAGATEYMTKPFSVVDLLTTIRKHTEIDS